MADFSSSQDIFDQAKPWQWRVIRASMGTTTGLVVMAMLAKLPKHGPALGPTCDIWVDGKVATKVRRYGIWGKEEIVGTVESVRDNVRRLADHCKLSDTDRESMFTELRKWVRKDFRARSEA